MEIGERKEQGASLRIEGYWHQLMGDDSESVRVIRMLRTEPERRRKGDATFLMAQVCVEADNARKILLLDAIPYEEGAPLDEGGLMLFYSRFGFKRISDDAPTMVREPRNVEFVRSH
jgi:GNAT superfamily N-acetyltransferase